MSASLVLGLVTVLGVAPVQDPPAVHTAPETFLRQAPPRGLRQPLFETPIVGVQHDPVPATRVVCGMTVVTPQIVPDMPRQTPPEGIEFTIRSMPPSMCRE